MILLGLVFGPAAGVIGTLAVEATRRDVRAHGTGLFLAIHYLFPGLGPLAMGAPADTTGTAAAPIALAGILFLACITLRGLFRLSRAQLAPSRPVTN